MSARAAAVRAGRPRGIYVPAADVPAHLANGWKLLDDCPGYDGALLAPPEPKPGVEIISQHSQRIGGVTVTTTFGRLKPNKGVRA